MKIEDLIKIDKRIGDLVREALSEISAEEFANLGSNFDAIVSKIKSQKSINNDINKEVLLFLSAAPKPKWASINFTARLQTSIRTLLSSSLTAMASNRELNRSVRWCKAVPRALFPFSVISTIVTLWL